uniref:Uncharacterized protein n=1 Tax=Arundo donax TaxID=35708 RepID=A0A0A9BD32_ARUDO
MHISSLKDIRSSSYVMDPRDANFNVKQRY